MPSLSVNSDRYNLHNYFRSRSTYTFPKKQGSPPSKKHFPFFCCIFRQENIQTKKFPQKNLQRFQTQILQGQISIQRADDKYYSDHTRQHIIRYIVYDIPDKRCQHIQPDNYINKPEMRCLHRGTC